MDNDVILKGPTKPSFKKQALYWSQSDKHEAELVTV